MKPLRTNKLRSGLSFARWLLAHQVRRRLPGLLGPDPIDRVDTSSVAHQFKINYCCKLDQPFHLEGGLRIRDLSYVEKTGYSFDIHRILAPFDELRFAYLPGDVTHVPEVPTLVKSRPIGEHNHNAVLLPLNTRRHFEFFDDPLAFEAKKSVLVWRGEVHQPHRAQFMAACAELPFCDLGTSRTSYASCQRWVKPWLTPQAQAQCKYLFVIEGNDVASNIRWAMNCNSLCFMRRPRYETWFGEGLLVPNEHYVEVADDFSDVEAKFAFYEANPQEALAIIRRSQAFVRAQLDLTVQYALARQVVHKYAHWSGATV